MADDKVRELAQELADRECDEYERVIRGKLKSLLDAASGLADGHSMTYYQVTSAIERLAAELKGWRKE